MKQAKNPKLGNLEIDGLPDYLKDLKPGDQLRIIVNCKVGKIDPKLDRLYISDEEVRVSRVK